MSDEKRNVPAGGERMVPARSVLTFLHDRTGKAPSVSLREEDSATAGAPLIDPSSEEKRALPRGRSTYQLLGEIARGGMGVILKGHDTDLGRDVAMKVLSKELAAHPEVVQRFVEEAQIGGQLQHPGIVPVYELGLMADERPYFTMKLVKGRTLASLLLERETPATNRRRLIDVFESVCQTMAYAHSRGVIHRDLKPANIMVGAFGEVQVVDWGLAKVLARGGTADERKARVAQRDVTILETVRSDGSGSGTDSLVGSVMGTPAYMPPEQASGLVDRLDERSDVFSLGAILCEILTGLPPYTGERSKIIADAAQAEYGDALARLDACGADAELVKLAKHCLIAAPAARPSNAGVVAERVHAYVASVEERAHAAQVEAAEARVREDEARVHVQQERKARKLTLALAAAVLGMALVGGGGWMFVQNERAAADRAVAARQQEDALRDRALASGVNEALNEASLRQGQEHWGDALLAAERARALAEGGGASEGLRASVAAVIEDLHHVESEARRRAELARDNELLLDELHEVHESDWAAEIEADWPGTSRQYAEIFRGHGLEIGGEDVPASAAALTARGIGSEIALVFDVWAQVCRAANEPARALRLLELAHLVDTDPLRADLREALENEELEVLRWIADSGFEDQPPLTLELLASSLNRLGDRDTALRVYRAAVRLHPSDFDLQLGLAKLLTPPRQEPGDPRELQEARSFYRAALALRPNSVVAYFHLGRVLDKLSEFTLAAESYATGLALRPDDGVFVHRLGRSLQWAGEHERGLPLFHRAIELGTNEWWVGWSHVGIADILTERGELEAAIAEYDRAMLVLPDVAQIRLDAGAVRVELGDTATVLQEMREAVRKSPGLIEAQNNLAWFLATGKGSSERDYAEAVELGLRVVAAQPDGNGFNTLGVARYMSGDLEGALADLERSLVLAKDDEDLVLAMDWIFLAMTLHRLGDEVEARVAYERAAAQIQASKITDREHLRFLAEAAVLLGIEEDE